MGILRAFLVTLIGLAVLSWIFPAINYVNTQTLVIASIVLTILQKIVQPVLKILFLPINIITLGLFSWVVDGLIIWFAILLVPGFHIDPITIAHIQLNSFLSLIFVAFALGIIQSIIELLF